MAARASLSRGLPRAALGAVMAFALSAPAHAIFADDEARKAILDLRERVAAQQQQLTEQRQQMEAQRQQMAEQRQQMEAQRQLIESQRQQLVNLRGSLDQQVNAAGQRLAEEGSRLSRSLLDLLQQIEGLRAELAKLRGTDEQLAREVSRVAGEISEFQRRQKDIAQGVDERLRRFEPVKVTVDGREFMVEPSEQRAFDAAMAVMRRGDIAGAGKGFADLLSRYPQSGYRGSALFWQGNALYTARDCNGALTAFRGLIQAAPEHSRAPEATLLIAACQVELKDVPAPRETLRRLLADYPQSEAAPTARERLSRLN